MILKHFSLSLWALVLAATTTAPVVVHAYEEDTHFIITYIVCRAVGFTHDEALDIGAVDQGMDDSVQVNAHKNGKPQVEEEYTWHALDKGGKMHAKGMIKRKQELAKAAIQEENKKRKLMMMGIFFHWQQDTWAHRHHNKKNRLSYNRYTTYNTPLGHARHGSQPDRPPYDQAVAALDFEDGIKYAMVFLNQGLERDTNEFFKGFQKQTANNVKKSLRGRGGTSSKKAPHRFVADIIRKQVASYSKDRAGYWNKAKYSRMRKNLQKVLDDWADELGTRIVIPSLKEKEQAGFMKMTTQQLKAFYDPLTDLNNGVACHKRSECKSDCCSYTVGGHHTCEKKKWWRKCQ